MVRGGKGDGEGGRQWRNSRRRCLRAVNLVFLAMLTSEQLTGITHNFKLRAVNLVFHAMLTSEQLTGIQSS